MKIVILATLFCHISFSGVAAKRKIWKVYSWNKERVVLVGEEESERKIVSRNKIRFKLKYKMSIIEVSKNLKGWKSSVFLLPIKENIKSVVKLTKVR